MPWQIRDLEGCRFGRLTAIRIVGFTKAKTKDGKWRSGSAIWETECECGTRKEVRGGSLTARKGGSRSCGCLKREQASAQLKGIFGQDSIGYQHRVRDQIKNLKGMVFNKWTVLERAEDSKRQDGQIRVRYLCECGCPARTRRVVASSSLTTGHSQSCGLCGSGYGGFRVAVGVA